MKSPKDMIPEEKKEQLKSIEAEISKLEELGRARTLLQTMEWMREREKDYEENDKDNLNIKKKINIIHYKRMVRWYYETNKNRTDRKISYTQS